MRAPRESVLVVGAGPAGCLAAIRLARAGLDVRLIDRGRRPPTIGETLSPEGRRALSRAGLWQRLPDGVARRCSAIATAWERSSLHVRSFLPNPYGPAWHLDRERFDAWLVSEALAEGVELVTATARSVERTDRGWTVTLDDGTIHVSSFVVAATGRTGAFASKLARRSRLDRLCVIGGFTEAVADRGEMLVVEAVPSGWWYSMPTPDGRLFAGWLTDARSFDAREASVVLASSFAETTHTRARVRMPPTLVIRPAACTMLASSVGDGWIALGDAALSRDPLSGDGLAAALRSGWDGAGTIIAAIAGDHGAWIEAKERNAQAARRYLEARASIYSAQRRWSEAAFWRARIADVSRTT